MKIAPTPADHLNDMVRRRNRELGSDAALKALLGIAFSFVTFGFLFWFGWYFGIFISRQVNLYAWQFGAILASVFFVVATWSAWRRVDPMAGLKPLTDRQMMLTLISQASGSLLYFSPRHASAGFAVLLIGGPASVLEAFGIWAHRIRADASLLAAASSLLASCQHEFPVEQVREPAAALLLKRLALIKVLPSGKSIALTLTEKGRAVLSGGGTARDKRNTT